MTRAARSDTSVASRLMGAPGQWVPMARGLARAARRAVQKPRQKVVLGIVLELWQEQQAVRPPGGLSTRVVVSMRAVAEEMDPRGSTRRHVPGVLDEIVALGVLKDTGDRAERNTRVLDVSPLLDRADGSATVETGTIVEPVEEATGTVVVPDDPATDTAMGPVPQWGRSIDESGTTMGPVEDATGTTMGPVSGPIMGPPSRGDSSPRFARRREETTKTAEDRGGRAAAAAVGGPSAPARPEETAPERGEAEPGPGVLRARLWLVRKGRSRLSRRHRELVEQLNAVPEHMRNAGWCGRVEELLTEIESGSSRKAASC